MCRYLGGKRTTGRANLKSVEFFDAMRLHKLDVSICLMPSICVSCTKSRGKFSGITWLAVRQRYNGVVIDVIYILESATARSNEYVHAQKRPPTTDDM